MCNIVKIIKPIMRYLLFSLIICLNLKGSQNNIILEDSFDPTIDKISHATTSFGLYYTFRYFNKSMIKSASYSFIVGCSYEIFQIYDPFEQEYFRGVSLHDITYNVSGIVSALILDKLLTGGKVSKFRNKIFFRDQKYYRFLNIGSNKK